MATETDMIYSNYVEELIDKYELFYDRYAMKLAMMSDDKFYQTLDNNNKYYLREFYVRNNFVFVPHNYKLELQADGKYKKNIDIKYKWGEEIKTIKDSLDHYNIDMVYYNPDMYTCLSLICGKEYNIMCIDIDDRSKCNPKLIDLLNKECKWIEVSGSSISDKLEEANKLHYFYQYDEELNYYHDPAFDILTDRHLVTVAPSYYVIHKEDSSKQSDNPFDNIDNSEIITRTYKCIRLAKPGKISQEIKQMLFDHDIKTKRNERNETNTNIPSTSITHPIYSDEKILALLNCIKLPDADHDIRWKVGAILKNANYNFDIYKQWFYNQKK